MKKRIATIVSICIMLAGIMGACATNASQNGDDATEESTVAPGTKVRISRTLAEREIPYINISSEEIALLDTLLEDPDIKAAIESEEIVNLTGSKSALFSGTLGSGLSVNEISVINKTLFFGYFFDGYRIILEMSQQGSIRKTVAVYDEAGNFRGSYENEDNRDYQKEIY